MYSKENKHQQQHNTSIFLPISNNLLCEVTYCQLSANVFWRLVFDLSTTRRWHNQAVTMPIIPSPNHCCHCHPDCHSGQVTEESRRTDVKCESRSLLLLLLLYLSPCSTSSTCQSQPLCVSREALAGQECGYWGASLCTKESSHRNPKPPTFIPNSFNNNRIMVRLDQVLLMQPWVNL